MRFLLPLLEGPRTWRRARSDATVRGAGRVRPAMGTGERRGHRRRRRSRFPPGPHAAVLRYGSACRRSFATAGADAKEDAACWRRCGGGRRAAAGGPAASDSSPAGIHTPPRAQPWAFILPDRNCVGSCGEVASRTCTPPPRLPLGQPVPRQNYYRFSGEVDAVRLGRRQPAGPLRGRQRYSKPSRLDLVVSFHPPLNVVLDSLSSKPEIVRAVRTERC